MQCACEDNSQVKWPVILITCKLQLCMYHHTNELVARQYPIPPMFLWPILSTFAYQQLSTHTHMYVLHNILFTVSCVIATLS